MKRILVLLFCVPFFALAQNKPLMIEGTAPNWYLDHTVAVKENYYSIGRMYNISPKEIAPFNNLELANGLSLNQAIRIPLTGNFVQNTTAAADEALVPVYHTVKEKEGLYRIATTYNKIPLEKLKQWNGITGDIVSNGTQLVVGYLKVKKELSALSGMSKPVPVANPTAVVKEDNTKTVPAKSGTSTAVVKEAQPSVKKPEVKPEKKKDPPVVKKEDNPVEKIEEVVQAPAKKDPPVVIKEPSPVKPVTRSGKNFNGGFFKTDFNKQATAEMLNETGTAAVFKSTSGWEDGKYYCLHNTAIAGSIVKVINTTTGKAIYAKVLDVIPDIKQNAGLLLRLSNAAANELGAGENKFDCTISLSK